jgi:hypothetical protein
MNRAKDNGSGWLTWLFKQEEVILAHLKHRYNRCRTSLCQTWYFPPIQGALELVNISKRKAEAGSSFMSPSSCNLSCKRRWEGLAAVAFQFLHPHSNVLVWLFKYLMK